MTTTPDAEAVAREAIADTLTEAPSNLAKAYAESLLDDYREAVERRVRASAVREMLAALSGPLSDFYEENVGNLRAHPDIPWGIGGKSGAEHVAEWRNDLADRIERLLAAFRAAQDHTGGGDG